MVTKYETFDKNSTNIKKIIVNKRKGLTFDIDVKWHLQDSMTPWIIKQLFKSFKETVYKDDGLTL